MARVAVTFKIMPEGPGTDLEEIRLGLRTAFEGALREVVERPVAFGLVSLEAIVVLDDAGGLLERSEQTIGALAGVSSVETLSVDLL